MWGMAHSAQRSMFADFGFVDGTRKVRRGYEDDICTARASKKNVLSVTFEDPRKIDLRITIA